MASYSMLREDFRIYAANYNSCPDAAFTLIILAYSADTFNPDDIGKNDSANALTAIQSYNNGQYGEFTDKKPMLFLTNRLGLQCFGLAHAVEVTRHDKVVERGLPILIIPSLNMGSRWETCAQQGAPQAAPSWFWWTKARA